MSDDPVQQFDEVLRELHQILLRLAEIENAIANLRQLLIQVSGQPPRH